MRVDRGEPRYWREVETLPQLRHLSLQRGKKGKGIPSEVLPYRLRRA